LAAVPGVTSAAFGGSLRSTAGPRSGFAIVGDPPVENRAVDALPIVSASYFRTLGIDLVRGRPFDDHDSVLGRATCMVNEEFVRRFLNGRDQSG
jgi:putative ABC transport system permease protein